MNKLFVLVDLCSETFLVIGPFNNQEELMYCKKYMETDFFRILLFFGRGTMQVSQEVFRFIPVQVFLDNSDIKWSNNLSDINLQLYAKYRFTDEEIKFINKIIRPV